MITFFVSGTPKPAGSKRGFINKKTHKVIMVDAAGQPGKDWRFDVKCAGVDAMAGRPPLRGPLDLRVHFCIQRPKSHYRTGKNADQLRHDAPVYVTTRPDSTKLLRGIEDSLSGVIWADDAQIAVQTVSKIYCREAEPLPGARIEVVEL